jgi:hypothetical protein
VKVLETEYWSAKVKLLRGLTDKPFSGDGPQDDDRSIFPRLNYEVLITRKTEAGDWIVRLQFARKRSERKPKLLLFRVVFLNGQDLRSLGGIDDKA